MREIDKIKRNSRTTEVASILQALELSYKSNTIEDPYLAGLFDKLAEMGQQLSFSINSDKVVSDLEAKDGVRDECLRAIFHLNNGYKYHPDGKISTSASVMDKVLSKYGLSIVSESYATQSAFVESLLKDVSTDDNKAVMDDLSGISVCFKNLDDAQNEFVDQYVAYKEAKAQADNYNSATGVKLEAIDLFNKSVVGYLNAMQQARPDMYEKFAVSVAQIIADNNANVKARRKKAVEAEE